jgi:hypothetical protein
MVRLCWKLWRTSWNEVMTFALRCKSSSLPLFTNVFKEERGKRWRFTPIHFFIYTVQERRKGQVKLERRGKIFTSLNSKDDEELKSSRNPSLTLQVNENELKIERYLPSSSSLPVLFLLRTLFFFSWPLPCDRVEFVVVFDGFTLELQGIKFNDEDSHRESLRTSMNSKRFCWIDMLLLWFSGNLCWFCVFDEKFDGGLVRWWIWELVVVIWGS